MPNPVDLSMAIKDHSIWKIRFVNDAIGSTRLRLDPHQVGASHLCDFGKWLAALSLAEKALEDYRVIELLHDRFHNAAAGIVQLSLSGQKEKSYAATTDFSSDFVYTSAKLINALAGWKRKLAG